MRGAAIKLNVLIRPGLGMLVLLKAAAGLAAVDGKLLYQRHCAACHGQRGAGGVGVPLALESFQSSITDRYLFKTIRNGRPGRVMPAFKRMSDAQIRAIVRYVRSFTPHKKLVLSSAPVKGDPVAGKKLYRQHCAACHGVNAEGGKGTGVTFSRPRDLPIIAPALANAGFLKATTDQMIKTTLMRGRKGTPMQSFLKKGLSEKQIDDIVAYIRSFEQRLARQDAPGKQGDAARKDGPAIIKVKSAYDMATTVSNLQKAITASNYKLIRTQPLEQGLVQKGRENRRQVILYFCNFNQLNTALAIDPRVGLFLPCRLTVVETGNGVFIYAINPSRLAQLYNNDRLSRICGAMRKTYLSIIEEATL